MEGIEFHILNWIQANCRSSFLDTGMVFVSWLGNMGAVWLVLAFGLMCVKKYRKAGAAVLVALVLDFVCCNLILKPFIGRVRPCDVAPWVTLLIPRPTDWSFPSGHAAASMAAVGALAARKCWIWKPVLVLACLICFSRMYLYVHWPSDVIAGSVIGLGLGCWASFLVKKYNERRGIDPD
jgi:undecaprenyl-diphosphatase